MDTRLRETRLRKVLGTIIVFVVTAVLTLVGIVVAFYAFVMAMFFLLESGA